MALNTGLQWKTKANVGKVRPHGFLQQTADSGAAVAAPSSPGSMVGITYPPCHTAQVWDFTGCTFFFFFSTKPLYTCHSTPDPKNKQWRRVCRKRFSARWHNGRHYVWSVGGCKPIYCWSLKITWREVRYEKNDGVITDQGRFCCFFFYICVLLSLKPCTIYLYKLS